MLFFRLRKDPPVKYTSVCLHVTVKLVDSLNLFNYPLRNGRDLLKEDLNCVATEDLIYNTV